MRVLNLFTRLGMGGVGVRVVGLRREGGEASLLYYCNRRMKLTRSDFTKRL